MYRKNSLFWMQIQFYLKTIFSLFYINGLRMSDSFADVISYVT